jgi:hypothetical protein
MYFKDLQKLTGQQVNWTMKLQDFDFIIKHVSRESNRRANALSRLEEVEKVSAKVGVVLLGRFFACFLSRNELKEEEDSFARSKEI